MRDLIAREPVLEAFKERTRERLTVGMARALMESVESTRQGSYKVAITRFPRQLHVKKFRLKRITPKK